MKLGLFGIGSGICAHPAVAKRIARRAEALGFDSLWTGEHVVLPDPRQAPSPAPPDFAMLHPSTALAYLAGVTKRVKLGTGITLIAQRNPVVLAKEMASLDVVSEGRLLLGIGAGYLHQEFAALGVPFQERGARTDEYVAAMRALWNDERPSFHGRFVQFDAIQAMPRPVQDGGPPIVVGGASDAALRRSVDYAQGWYGFALNVEQTAGVLERLRRLGGDGLEISVTPSVRLNTETLAQYAELGVHRLIALLPQDEARTLEAMAEMAELADLEPPG